ncbi:ATP-binding cassette domain-containing protein [Allokutzneria sp. A3M-2-11 16]|uniref:ATP-binding cassette domain-containing protein n=1 Tax=Allokutzneria sp. A3M-2-11 16 TaxID=2962043 RepID=UPI0020B6F74F|nr:ATP-binding cassette domain-containing protein [Allokutzneria sp. A3M-2-11 16]MCP3798764.1 ATP-binding cassette domain-containing protein [Allokutzneria sp. A3M-2-11 16]
MIRVRGLTRRFTGKHGTVDAVRGVDLDVEAGELVGFLGPNGAGKTTTLRMLTTLLRPTSGEARVAGRDLLTDPDGVRERIGYVAQSGTLAFDYPVHEELEMQGRFYGLDRARARSRCTELLAELDLSELHDRLVATLSGGQRRRLDIAMGLVHSPELLFLDEPTTGLDPTSRAALWDRIRALRDERGMTVFLSTHYLDEADALCDRLLVIDNGVIVASGSPDELKRSVSGDAVTMTVHSGAIEAGQVADGIDGTSEVTVDGEVVRLRVRRGDEALPVLLNALRDKDIELASVTVKRPTLDDVFHSVTGRSLHEEVAA